MVRLSLRFAPESLKKQNPMQTTAQAIRVPLAAFLSASLLLVIQALYYYPRMPDQIASHFDMRGKANGWMSKGEFPTLEAAVFCLVGGVFLAVGFLLPKLPVDLINIPHKSYWLAEERRAETFAYMSRALLWFGNLGLFALIGLFQLVYRLNLNAGTDLPTSFHYFFGAYLICALFLIVRLLIHFSKPPAPSS